MSLEKNFETYKAQYRNRGKVENAEEDIRDFRIDFYDGFFG